MTKKQIYICLLIAFISTSFLALYFESFWTGLGATLLLIILIDDKDRYLEKEEEKPLERALRVLKENGKYGKELKKIEDNRIGEFIEVKEGSIKRIDNLKMDCLKNGKIDMMSHWGKEIANEISKERKSKKLKLAVTSHAKRRIIARLKCKPEKYEKIIKKAWKSKNEMSNELISKIKDSDNYTENTELRYYLGYVFIFTNEEKRGSNKKVLITLYDPKVYN